MASMNSQIAKHTHNHPDDRSMKLSLSEMKRNAKEEEEEKNQADFTCAILLPRFQFIIIVSFVVAVIICKKATYTTDYSSYETSCCVCVEIYWSSSKYFAIGVIFVWIFAFFRWLLYASSRVNALQVLHNNSILLLVTKGKYIYTHIFIYI